MCSFILRTKKNAQVWHWHVSLLNPLQWLSETCWHVEPKHPKHAAQVACLLRVPDLRGLEWFLLLLCSVRRVQKSSGCANQLLHQRSWRSVSHRLSRSKSQMCMSGAGYRWTVVVKSVGCTLWFMVAKQIPDFMIFNPSGQFRSQHASLML